LENGEAPYLWITDEVGFVEAIQGEQPVALQTYNKSLLQVEIQAV